MADGDTTPGATPPAGHADPAVVGAAAGEAAASSGATPAQARTEARQAADAASEHRLPDEQLDAIADRTISRLEARGAFEQPAPPPPPAENEPAEPRAEPVEVPPPPPRKRKFAERFVGRS